MGDTFNQNHSGSGNNIINLGKQPFLLTDVILAQILDAVRTMPMVEIEPHGVQASFPMAEIIVGYLHAHGINARLGGGVCMLIPPPQGPLELRGNQLIVDASR